MNIDRFLGLTGQYANLRIAVVGDFCLDRYLEIDPSKQEVSIETHLAVHNVTNVRAQAGAAGTVLNNLSALGVGEIYPVGFCGKDGEGFELQQAMAALPGAKLDHFFPTPLRRTFCYCKPLVLEPGKPPRELERLDTKNWTATPKPVEDNILQSLAALRGKIDAVIVMEQVDAAETGVITARVREALMSFPPEMLVMADSRRGLGEYPPVVFKMNAAELAILTGAQGPLNMNQVKKSASALARKNSRRVIVTMAEQGLIGAQPDGKVVHVPALPVRGPIDIVGAGDAVTSNATTALAAGATLEEALELAAVGSSVVIHQLGTTGTASVEQLQQWMFPAMHAA